MLVVHKVLQHLGTDGHRWSQISLPGETRFVTTLERKVHALPQSHCTVTFDPVHLDNTMMACIASVRYFRHPVEISVWLAGGPDGAGNTELLGRMQRLEETRLHSWARARNRMAPVWGSRSISGRIGDISAHEIEFNVQCWASECLCECIVRHNLVPRIKVRSKTKAGDAGDAALVTPYLLDSARQLPCSMSAESP